jgi:hypothetical protein
LLGRLLNDCLRRLLLRRGIVIQGVLLLVHNEQNDNCCQRDDTDHNRGQGCARYATASLWILSRFRMNFLAPSAWSVHHYSAVFCFAFLISHCMSPSFSNSVRVRIYCSTGDAVAGHLSKRHSFGRYCVINKKNQQESRARFN